MIIEETMECNEIDVVADVNIDLRQFGEWIQMDKQQAAKLIDVLTKWINGEVIN